LAARPLPDREQQRLGLGPEEREQQQLLLARGEAPRTLPERVEVDLGLLGVAVPEERDGTREPGVDRGRRLAEASLDEVPQLVDDRGIAVRAEHVDERLRGDDLADWCG